MDQLYDIKGYWGENRSKDFSEKNMWSGQLILRFDGWFEGIVTDVNNPDSGPRYIFGAYFPGVGIELFMFSAPEVSPPIIYRVGKNDQDYDGLFATLDVYGEHTMGYCRITTAETKEQDPELNENLYGWSLNLMLYDQLNDLYESIKNDRSNYLEIVRNKYKKEIVAEKEKSESEESTIKLTKFLDY